MWQIIVPISSVIAIVIALFRIKVKCPICGGSGSTYCSSGGTYIPSDDGVTHIPVIPCSNCSETSSVSLLNWLIIRVLKRKSSIVR